jgi:FkbM family methyltransferase
MRIFLDVGAHVGETLAEVIKPEYGFDRIVAFEPSLACLPALEVYAKADPRIEICREGLSDRTASAKLFQAGSEAGSVLGALGENPDHGNAVETIELIETGTWLRNNTAPDDLVVMKTNCEGSEVAIVENLLDTGMLSRVYSLLITWDIRMYPGGLARERTLRKRLSLASAHNFCSSDDVMIGPTHCDRIANWLSLFGLNVTDATVLDLRQRYSATFQIYSEKSGRWPRFEHSIKKRMDYNSFPTPIRRLMQGIKRALGMNRERKPGAIM